MVWTLAYSGVDELSSNHCSFHCMSESECNGPESHQMWLRNPWFWTPWPWHWKISLAREGGKNVPYLHCSICICEYYLLTRVHEEWSIVGPLTIYYCCGTCTNTIAMHYYKKEVSNCWFKGWVFNLFKILVCQRGVETELQNVNFLLQIKPFILSFYSDISDTNFCTQTYFYTNRFLHRYICHLCDFCNSVWKGSKLSGSGAAWVLSLKCHQRDTGTVFSWNEHTKQRE